MNVICLKVQNIWVSFLINQNFFIEELFYFRLFLLVISNYKCHNQYCSTVMLRFSTLAYGYWCSLNVIFIMPSHALSWFTVWPMTSILFSPFGLLLPPPKKKRNSVILWLYMHSLFQGGVEIWKCLEIVGALLLLRKLNWYARFPGHCPVWLQITECLYLETAVESTLFRLFFCFWSLRFFF